MTFFIQFSLQEYQGQKDKIFIRKDTILEILPRSNTFAGSRIVTEQRCYQLLETQGQVISALETNQEQ